MTVETFTHRYGYRGASLLVEGFMMRAVDFPSRKNWEMEIKAMLKDLESAPEGV